MQYTPVINGVSQWQNFHGDDGTAAVGLPAEQWIPLRLEQGRNELRLVVTESFGGWGLIARWVDADGIAVAR